MDEISLHIDFLLHTHDCVIVPGLGGFVVNTTDVERNGLWGLNAPSYELIFNSKLSYNDGLLAESLMKTNNESYEVAINKIKSASEELRNNLLKQDEVVWNNLGTFKINKENILTFLPNKSYIRPQLYGLTNSRLKPAGLILSETSDKENLIPIKSFFRYVASAVAVALLLFFAAVSYNNYNSKSQHADIVSKPLIFNKNHTKTISPKTTQPTVEANNLKAASSKTTNTTASLTSKADNEITQSPLSSSVNYYIVVGVYEVREVAEKTLSTLKNQGFSTASMIERPKRLDVYSASFSNRNEAQAFLHKFQTEHSNYRDAWILKR